MQESGQTSIPIFVRANMQRLKKSTTHLFGLWNAIARLEYSDICSMPRSYAVFMNWDPSQQQLALEALLHIMGSNTLELGGSNFQPVRISAFGGNTTPYDLALKLLFDGDMIERLNAHYTALKDLEATAKSYVTGEISRLKARS